MKRSWVILLVAGIFLAAMSLRFSHRRGSERRAREAAWQALRADREAELKSLSQRAQVMNLPLVLPPSLPDGRKPSPSAQPQIGAPGAATSSATPPGEAPPPPASIGGKPPIQDPLAREALSLVGSDPEAEAIWATAINNPDLPANERKDLIEDLNEEGFADPKNPTIDELPLIVSRLALIEDYAAEAMDDVNWQAFMEAYKDLRNMYVRLTGE
ncbi:MAG TPA: hypothetical protein VMZ27_06380 [Candidatus Saccharimonadales bacterium]|nr:hypothetical protein [Candidatus Saccharimonadales bacterium]